MSGRECKPDRAQPSITMRSNRGFTLIEVLVATSVLGIVAVALFGLLSASLSNLHKVEDLHHYELAAQDTMDRVLLLPTLPVPATASGQVENSNARWTVNVDLWAPSNLDKKPTEVIAKVRVLLSWPGRSGDRTIELESLRATKPDSYDLQESIQTVYPR